MPTLHELLEVIRNPQSRDGDVAGAIARLPARPESHEVWTAIANDGGYRAMHRRRAIVALFRRHATPLMTVGALAELLDGAPWVREGDLTIVDVLGGKIPVQWTFEDTVCQLDLRLGEKTGDEPPWSIYLRIAGNSNDAERVVEALHGVEVPGVSDRRIVEFGIWTGEGG